MRNKVAGLILGLGLFFPVMADHPTNDLIFYAAHRAGELPLTVDFVNLSEGDYLRWHWDFGDGDTSSVSAPSHTYTKSGIYPVSLTGWTGDTYKTVTFPDLVEARFLNPCNYGNWDIGAQRMELTTYIAENEWVTLPEERDSVTEGRASFVFDSYGGDYFNTLIRVIPDTAGTSSIAMEINSVPVFSWDVLPNTQFAYIETVFYEVGYDRGDTVTLIGGTDGIGRARLQGVQIFILADCFGPAWSINYPDSATVWPGTTYKATPYIYGCWAPCRQNYYIEQGPDSMKIDMLNGQITWTPTAADTGECEVVIKNRSDQGERTTTIYITVPGPDAITDWRVPVTADGLRMFYYFDVNGKRILKPGRRGIYLEVDEMGIVRKRIW